jgi:hypothetical protein
MGLGGQLCIYLKTKDKVKYSLKLSTPPHYTQFYAIYFHHFVSEEST